MSILLAFGIDAWWSEKGEVSQTREHLAAVRVELVQNLDLIATQAVECADIDRATLGILSLMRPDPDIVASDSLISLLGEALWPGVGNRLNTTALDAMIAEGQFASIESADLRRGLSEWLSSQVPARTQQRDNTRTKLQDTEAYLETLMPYQLVIAEWGSVDGSAFPLDVGQLLSDPRLEGSLAQLRMWRNTVCFYDGERKGLAERLLVLIDGELAE